MLRSIIKCAQANRGSVAIFSSSRLFSVAAGAVSAPNIVDIARRKDDGEKGKKGKDNNRSASGQIGGEAKTILKHKTPRRRASSLHEVLKNEERDRLVMGRVYPELVSGDSVRIEKLPFASAEKPDVITGVIIAKYNKTYDTRIDVLNMVDGVGVKWMIRIYDPLIKSISIIDKRFAYRFKKTTRSRSKLYYLFDKDPTLYQVKNDENDVRAPKTAKK